jgi:hypothetical protein
LEARIILLWRQVAKELIVICKALVNVFGWIPNERDICYPFGFTARGYGLVLKFHDTAITIVAPPALLNRTKTSYKVD